MGHVRLVVRYTAAIIKKFASSIAPHITTLLVHGKQVITGQGLEAASARLVLLGFTAVCV